MKYDALFYVKAVVDCQQLLTAGHDAAKLYFKIAFKLLQFIQKKTYWGLVSYFLIKYEKGVFSLAIVVDH